jgi:hypothetical protein
MITAANTNSPGASASSGSGGTLGFAIPINRALAIARQIASGQPSATVHIGLPGFLGVEVATSDSSSPRQEAADEAQSGRNGPDRGRSQLLLHQRSAGRRPGARRADRGGRAHRPACCATRPPSRRAWCRRRDHVGVRKPVTTPGSLTSITGNSHPGDVVSGARG